uniref:NADH-ubiquinone oxidoreductase chain 2 n=1 Tax=Tylomelania sarasinorum TaxID=232253 RepID=A0A2Z1Q303_9CAEN|nr:NADH dehydrogenase subunit 2 [Tylomelania sarasinorum]AND97136.1 NADH dehydrogenase subunit 2 [Tylomelania sarasinorum]
MLSGLPFGYLFVVVMVFGTLFSLSSSHWLGIWAGLEVNLIGFLPILVYQKSMLESESAVKYFIVQALGSSFLVLGSLLSYSLSFSWESIETGSFLSYLGAVFLCLGLFMKMGVFPFYFWLPSVMAGLSWVSCLLLTTWQKVVPVFLVAAVMDVNLLYAVFFVFLFMSAGSSIIGGIGGMNQTQVRALLAYSSIGHMGWILFSVCCSEWAVKIYFCIYVLVSVCVFFNLWFLDSSGMKSLSCLSKGKWVNSFSILVMLLSLGGLPPLLGFVSKWAAISSATGYSSWGILFFLILGSLMSLFYYLSLFFSEVLSLKLDTLIFEKNKIGVSSLEYSNSIVVFINLLGGVMLLLFVPVKFF